MQLTDQEWEAFRKRHVAFLNRFGGEALGPSYLVESEVHGDYRDPLDPGSRYLMLTVRTADSEGPAYVNFFLRCYVEENGETNFLDPEAIEFASYTFDTMTATWIDNYKEVNETR